MPLIFEKEVVKEGLPGFRFRPRDDVFMSPERFPEENSCFAGNGKVTGDGVFDVTICQFNAPIVLSWPHFLHAEPKFKDKVEGMSPDKEKHGFWFDIQPTTGTTLSAKARVQINVMVRNSSYFEDLSKVNDTVVPVLWFEEGIDELGEDIVKVLRTAAVDPDTYRLYILYCFIVLISTVILLSMAALAQICRNRASMRKMREQLQDRLQSSRYDREQAGQPMLGPFMESNDSSRVTTATHSRNCSEGTKPPYIKDVNSENLLEKLPQFVNRTPPYNTIQVDVPEALLDGDQEDEASVKDSLEDGSSEGEDSESEEGVGPNVVLINSRHRITSSSSFC